MHSKFIPVQACQPRQRSPQTRRQARSDAHKHFCALAHARLRCLLCRERGRQAEHKGEEKQSAHAPRLPARLSASTTSMWGSAKTLQSKIPISKGNLGVWWRAGCSAFMKLQGTTCITEHLSLPAHLAGADAQKLGARLQHRKLTKALQSCAGAAPSPSRTESEVRMTSARCSRKMSPM